MKKNNEIPQNAPGSGQVVPIDGEAIQEAFELEAQRTMEPTRAWKGTSGPWVAQRNSRFWKVKSKSGTNRMIIHVFLYDKFGNQFHHTDENEANATAIAAVPELLEAVQMAHLFLMEQMDGLPCTISLQELREATDRAMMAKAEL